MTTNNIRDPVAHIQAIARREIEKLRARRREEAARAAKALRERSRTQYRRGLRSVSLPPPNAWRANPPVGEEIDPPF